MREIILNVWSKIVVPAAVKVDDPIEVDLVDDETDEDQVVQPDEDQAENLSEHEKEVLKLANYTKSCFPNLDLAETI